jgi:hypothetical protein
MNKTPEEWAKVIPEYAIIEGSRAQAANAFQMALEDIAEMARTMRAWQVLVGQRVIEMHKNEHLAVPDLERAAAQLWRKENPDKSVFACDHEERERYRSRVMAGEK